MADSPVMARSDEPVPGFFGRVFGVFNVFLDPAGAARAIHLSWSWVAPLLLAGIVIGVCQYLKLPVTLRVIQINPPNNMTPEQVANSLPIIEKTQKVMVFLIPVFGAIMAAIMGGLLTAACAVMNIKSRFRDNFALVAAAGLIQVVGFAAGTAVVLLKGEDIQTTQGLNPGFGLDLIMPEGINKFLMASLNYFSVFTIWYIIMLALTLAAMTGARKGKAFAATAPVWLVSLLFVMIGAMFQRG